MSRYIWLKKSPDEIADQLPAIVDNALQAPFDTLLQMSPADAAKWREGAAWFRWMQKERIPAFRTFAQSLTDTRDLFEVDKTPETLIIAGFIDPPAPAILSGKTVDSNFLPWADGIVRAWKAVPGFTEALQRQLGLEVPVGEANAPSDSPKIVDIKMQSGGMVRVRVFKGGHDLVEVRIEVDGVKILTEKTVQSTVEMRVEAGAAHALEVSCRFLNRDNTPASDWSAVVSASSLA